MERDLHTEFRPGSRSTSARSAMLAFRPGARERAISDRSTSCLLEVVLICASEPFLEDGLATITNAKVGNHQGHSTDAFALSSEVVMQMQEPMAAKRTAAAGPRKLRRRSSCRERCTVEHCRANGSSVGL